MSTYENAYEGIKKIRMGVILKLLAAILGIVGVMLMGVVTGMQLMEGDFGIAAIGTLSLAALAVMLITLVISVVSYVLMLLGLSKAGLDNDSFKRALMWVIISLVITVIINILPNLFPVAFISAVYAINSVMDLIVISFVVKGCAEILPEFEAKARFIQIMVLIPVIISVIAQIATLSPAIASICGIVSIVATVVYFFEYLSFLGKVKKTLERN